MFKASKDLEKILRDVVTELNQSKPNNPDTSIKGKLTQSSLSLSHQKLALSTLNLCLRQEYFVEQIDYVKVNNIMSKAFRVLRDSMLDKAYYRIELDGFGTMNLQNKTEYSTYSLKVEEYKINKLTKLRECYFTLFKIKGFYKRYLTRKLYYYCVIKLGDYTLFKERQYWIENEINKLIDYKMLKYSKEVLGTIYLLKEEYYLNGGK